MSNLNQYNFIESEINDLVLPEEGCCFHCGEPVPEPPFTAHILGESRLMCCLGCQLAAESIVEAGLEQYYLDRSEINRTASLPTELERLKAYDHDDVKSQFVYAAEGKSVAELSVNNLRCAACTWLIESRLYELEGVEQCQVNLTNQRMRVVWDEQKLPISDILLSINQIGYDAKPYRQDTHEAMLAKHNKQMLIRLGIAALGAMQAMMFAVGMYFGNYSSYSGMLIEQRDFLRWVSLFVSIPVFFYCAVPFFSSAWVAVKARQVNMDVPVSIALIVTFFASLYATVSGHGETYYDSVSMFVFFLLAGRYIEHNARLKAANMANDLVVVEPTLVQRLAQEPALAIQFKRVLESNSLKQNDLDDNVSDASDVFNASDASDVFNASDVSDRIHDSINSDLNEVINKQDYLDKLERLGLLIDVIQNNKQNNKQNTKKYKEQLKQPPNSSDATNFDITQINGSQLNTQIELEVENEASDKKVTAHSLKVGDVIMIEAGSEVVADGILCSKSATVSQSLLTGESLLIVKHRGDLVIGGSQNDSQPFIMIVTALPENSQIALIDRLMNRAMSEKPKVAEQADKWARWFVARILILSIFVFIGWYFVDPSKALWSTVAVLVATCPCALSLATPIALTVSTNRLASYGFLTTRGHTIQTLGEITHVAFDKTGTLTYGKPNLLYIDTFNSPIVSNSFNDKEEDRNTIIAQDNSHLLSNKDKKETATKGSSYLDSPSNISYKDDILGIAAALEVGSRHPIAKALLDAAYQIHLPDVKNLMHHTAGGVEGIVKDRFGESLYRLGHINFALQKPDQESNNYDDMDQKYLANLDKHNASTAVMLSRCVNVNRGSFDEATFEADYSQSSQIPVGQSTVVWEPVALFYFNDSIREGVIDLIASLRQQSIKTLILTGDPSEHAKKVATQLDVDNLYYGLSPEDKVNHINQLQQQGHIVMMVGDGINDAPVLAAANISTAIAGAADLAQVSSDSVILNGSVTSVLDAKRIADKAQLIIKQNLHWALGYNAIVLLPAAFGYVPPWLAAIGMSLSSLIVVLNALRLKRA